MEEVENIVNNNNNNHDQNHDDHDHDHDEERESGVGGSRWNPTKEQIGILEKMYSEGIRTPSAEQIQQITARLRVYGHIEGKNVFYWFQNHKARQRQKLRQERLAAAHVAANNYHINHRFLGPNPLHNPLNNHNVNPRPIFPAPPHLYHHHPHYLPNPNVMCSSYYQLPQTNLGHNNFYPPQFPQHHYSAPSPDLLSPKRSKAMEMPRGGLVPPTTLMANTTLSGDHHHHGVYHDQGGNYMGMRTLDLFPVHPTGILEHKLGNSTNNSAENSSATCSSDDNNHIYYNGNPQLVFDFFSSGHGSN